MGVAIFGTLQTMTKSELIDRLARRFPGISAADVRISAGHILDGLTRALAASQRIEIRGFGTFRINKRQPLIARNPKTGETIAVPGKAVPHFKAGKLLREGVAFRDGRKASPKRYRLDDLLAQIPAGTKFEELDWGPPVGQEVL